MSYLQVETRGGYITRSLNLSVSARAEGYPGYLVNITDQRSSVRTILYLEDNILYLTDDKTFFLSSKQLQNEEYIWIFTSNPNMEPLTLSAIQDTWGAIGWSWRDEWANMKTDSPTRNNLIWSVRSWEEAWNLIEATGYIVSFRRIGDDFWDDRWITPVDSFGNTTFITGAFAWKQNSPAPFKLHKKGSDWTLQYMQEGTLHADIVFSLEASKVGAYIVSWSEGDSNRWLLTGDVEEALYFQVKSPQDGVYEFNHGDRRLNQGGYWTVRPFTSYYVGSVHDGVEFYNGNDNATIYMNTYVIAPELNDTMRYRLSQNQFVNLMRDQNNFLPDYNPQGVIANLPRGSPTCNENEWEGINVNCYRRANTPYVQARGEDQCTTLDDFANDVHCQQWAITNRGPRVDTQLYNLCRNTSDDTYPTVCSCFRPDQTYYNAILQQRRNDPELARQVANDVRATNLLQCVSGLCVPGTFSANVFYHGSRKCDVCIQALRTNIQAGGNITGNINLRQVCAQSDVTYTWTDLIARLQDLGAYKLSRSSTGVLTSSGIFPHVIINADGTSIKLVTSTKGGREAISNSRLLSSIDSKDSQGNVILSQERWRSNTAGYSNEVLVFFLEAREE